MFKSIAVHASDLSDSFSGKIAKKVVAIATAKSPKAPKIFRRFSFQIPACSASELIGGPETFRDGRGA
jgi:hypothetical protein